MYNFGNFNYFNYYFDFVLKIVAHELDEAYPEGYGIKCNYRIPCECSNRVQRLKTGGLSGIEIIQWILYADDLVFLCREVLKAQRTLQILHDTCVRFGLTISFGKTKSLVFNDEELAKKEHFLEVDGNKIENVAEFCYLGHTISNKNELSYTELRTASAIGKFNELSGVLCDQNVNMGTRRRILEACVRSRLTYATQAWYPREEEMKKLESCWYSLLRKMIRGGWKRKSSEDEASFALQYTNKDVENIVKTTPLRDFINCQYLRYIAHICRSSNNEITKKMMFMIPSKKYYRDSFLKIAGLLGGVSKTQALKATQSKQGFTVHI